MKNLAQIRAGNALAFAKSGREMRGKDGGEAIKRIPPMISTNGLLAALAFSMERRSNGPTRPGYVAIFDAIADHLQDPEIAITKGTGDAEKLLQFLIESDSQTLKLATAEALEWLSYARRFVRPEKFPTMIPLAKDTRGVVGEFAERVSNRSLLFQKMVLPKSVLHRVDRFNDAQRFNVLRATHDGCRILREESDLAKIRGNRTGKPLDNYIHEVASRLATVNVDQPDLAESRFRSYRRFLLELEKSYQTEAVTFVASLGGRLLINMAGGVMENAGLALDRVTGLPFIPGSAVKGVTRSVALWEIRHEKDALRQTHLLRLAMAAFGFASNDINPKGDFLWAVRSEQETLDAARKEFPSDTYKGICSFLAAHPVNDLQIVAEVLTPHTTEPRPIFFPAVEAGSEFGFAIVAQRTPPPSICLSEMLEQVRTWLCRALSQSGIGAKTGAGYGWFQIDPRAEETFRKLLEEEKVHTEHARLKEREKDERLAAESRAREAEAARLASLNPEDRAKDQIQKLNQEQFADFAKKLPEKEEHEQRAFISILLTSQKDTRKRWQRRKPEIWNGIVAVAAKLQINLP